jgi:hypothetical protein
MADSGRAEIAKTALKDLQGLGKKIGQSSVSSVISKSPYLSGTPLSASTLFNAVLYIGTGIFAVILILMAVDQWVTPIFQTKPGSKGFLLLPGTDTSQVYWTNIREVDNILIGLPSPTYSEKYPGAAQPLSTTVIEEQDSYTITLDVYIENEFPQDIGTETSRKFFVLGPSLSMPTITMSLDNLKNTVYITVIDTDGNFQSCVLDNVPIHKPFRIGFTKSGNIIEGYINGKLEKTINLRSKNLIKPTTGSLIFAPSKITSGSGAQVLSLSKGIKVMNMRLFGYAVSPSEMIGRMSDLIPRNKFDSSYTPSSLTSTFTSFTGMNS